MLPPCPRCGKNNFKSSRDRNTHINCQIPCEPKNGVNEPEGTLYPQEYASLHQRNPEEFGQALSVLHATKASVTPKNDVANKPNKQSEHDVIKELRNTIKELASQMNVLTWNLQNMATQFKDMRGAVTVLSDQQEEAQSKIEEIEEVISQHPDTLPKKLDQPDQKIETISQHSGLAKSVHSGLRNIGDIASQHSGTKLAISKVSQHSHDSNSTDYKLGILLDKYRYLKKLRDEDNDSIKAEIKQLKHNYTLILPAIKRCQLAHYNHFLKLRPLDNKDLAEGRKVLEWFLSMGL